MKNFLLAILILVLIIPDIAGQEWIVPADKKDKLSTFLFDENTRNEGEKLFTVNCLSCHGTPGKGNYLNLVPTPGDPATDKIQKNIDGELFYKIATGRGQMPNFKSVLSSNEIWNVISYIRSFNSTYKQQVMPVITSSAYPGSVIKIMLSYISASNAVMLNATAEKNSISVPVTGAEVRLFVHRTFGLLPVDEAKTTDKDGVAIFALPSNIRGDTAGNLGISARFTNEDIFGSVTKDTLIYTAQKSFPVSLVAERAMWNNVRKAPLWILLSYGLGVIAAWSFILYVLMKLRDIFIIGKYIRADDAE